jgi:hypothetical protein
MENGKTDAFHFHILTLNNYFSIFILNMHFLRALKNELILYYGKMDDKGAFLLSFSFNLILYFVGGAGIFL